MTLTIGHRGAGILEPENTIRALKRAIELGLDQAEIDVRITKEKKLVVFHHESTDGISPKRVLLRELTYDELQKINKGNEPIPTLSETIDFSKGKISLRLDVKDDIADELADFLNKNKFSDCVVMFRNKDELRKLKQKLPNIKTAFLVTDPRIDAIAGAKEAKADGIHLGSKCVSKKVIDLARKEGLMVAIGNYSTEEDIKRALEFNPDYISSEMPDLLVTLIKFRENHEEFVDVVDESDTILRSATWKEMMEKSLLHRTSNTMVFNSEGKLFVHKRAEHLKLYPGLWDVKFGGSVRSGETYEDAAKRELFEEAGIHDLEIKPIFKLRNKRKENNVHRSVFKCVYDSKITLDKSEVAEGKFMKIDEVKALLNEGKLSPSAVDVFTNYLTIQEKNGGKM